MTVYPDFTSGGILYPGILEPMLTVNMPTVHTQYTTKFDSVLNGVMVTIKGLNVWRTYVDSTFKVIPVVVNNVVNRVVSNVIISGISNIVSTYVSNFILNEVGIKLTNDTINTITNISPVVSAVEFTPCSQFQVYKQSGEFIECKPSQKPVFGVASGAIMIKGEEIQVPNYSGTSSQTFPLNFYLELDKNNSTWAIVTTRTSGASFKSYHIGGVNCTNASTTKISGSGGNVSGGSASSSGSSSSSESNNCKIYNIWQAQCEFDDNDDDGGDSAFIAVVVDAPSKGYGNGGVMNITVDGTGAYKAVGEKIDVVFPFIG